MANTLQSTYDPTFFTNEALIALENALGMAGRVHRGYEDERISYGKGQTISIPRPATFTAEDHVPGTGSSTQDLDTGEVQILLDQHKEVKFAVTDRELSYGSDRIINDHIRPAAYAMADKIDQALCSEYLNVPWAFDIPATVDVTAITGPRNIMRGNKVPLDSDIHYMVDGALEAEFLGLNIFHSADTTGGTANQGALMRGTLGERFGAEVFVNQNVQTHASGTVISVGTDVVGGVNGAHAKDAASLAVDSFAGTETFKTGDAFAIAGSTQRYVVTADAALTAGAVTLSIFPGLVAALAGGEVVTFEDGSSAGIHADSFAGNLMFHRNAFALAMAPLPDTGDGKGAQISSLVDPRTGLSLRARMWYNGDTATNYVALDALYGVKTLDANLACRGRRDV